MEFQELAEFNKDVKRLSKKYKSLKDDIQVVKQVLAIFPDERPPFSFRINNLGIETCVIKVKKIACRALKGKGVNSGLRLVYAHYAMKTDEEKRDEKIVLVELYHKNEKSGEDRARILTYFE